jgi:cytochrome c5
MTQGTGAVLGAAFAFATGLANSLHAEPLPRPAQGQSDTERGEKLMNASCQGCHELRTLQTQAKNADEWTKSIEDMIGKGAKIEKADIPVLVDYLVDHYGPLPNGPGKVIVLNVCTMCHDLKRIRYGRRSEQEWEETLNAMLNEGAPLSDDQFPIVHAYLSRNFGIE